MFFADNAIIAAFLIIAFMDSFNIRIIITVDGWWWRDNLVTFQISKMK